MKCSAPMQLADFVWFCSVEITLAMPWPFCFSYFRAIFGPPLETLTSPETKKTNLLDLEVPMARKSRVPMMALAFTITLMVCLPAFMVPNSFRSSRQNLWDDQNQSSEKIRGTLFRGSDDGEEIGHIDLGKSHRKWKLTRGVYILYLDCTGCREIYCSHYQWYDITWWDMI